MPVAAVAVLEVENCVKPKLNKTVARTAQNKSRINLCFSFELIVLPVCYCFVVLVFLYNATYSKNTRFATSITSVFAYILYADY